ncbi:MFS transporter [Pseudonocardia hydrocarbonoxydans]|uniref:MFS transporter n=1 Tax=Pseudonocardia hydrocarbonoxydans TaxID=76726 RepID=A0A4Y3WPP9_9PSEU|nr:MFS transporter [Pseudonocardia hydrocarbonoxydans]GEC19366.1 MFS transporter [Pseudonocardia hydrocarbonoxydans]
MRLREEPGFRRFWLASTVSYLGTAVGSVALVVLVERDLDGSAADLGAVSAARWAPYLLVGLFAGVLADRVRRRPLLVATDAGRALVLAVVVATALAGVLTIPVLAGLMLVFGTLSIGNDAAHQSFLPRLLPRAALPRANARIEQSEAVAQTGGQAVGGGLVGWLGAPLGTGVDALSHAVSAVLLARTAPEDPVPREPPGLRRVLAQAGEGLAWVYRHPTLRPLALGTHWWFVCHSLLTTVYAFFALRELGIGAVGLGVTYAVAGVGALAGTTQAQALADRVGIGTAIAGSRVLEAGGFAVVITASVAPSPVAATAVAAAGQFVVGLGMGLEGPTEMSYRQGVTADGLQGRTGATMRSFNRAAITIGAPTGGVLADVVGFRPALWVGVVGMAAGGVALARSGLRHAVRG